MVLNQMLSIENLGLIAELKLGLLFMEVLLFGTSVFLMLLILVQRGKGGGLTGALGGMGGQSAFGSKAGDAFTKITVITAVIWIMLCMVTIAGFNPPPTPKATSNNDAALESMGENFDEIQGDRDADAMDDDDAGDATDDEGAPAGDGATPANDGTATGEGSTAGPDTAVENSGDEDSPNDN